MQAVLFDLDGTLLDIDLQTFLSSYFRSLASATEAHFPGVDVRSAVRASTDMMSLPHPGRTNAAAFHADFLERTGLDLDDPGTYAVFEAFYAQDFPKLKQGASAAPGARRAVETALDAGLAVVIATQPIFPRPAIEHRLAWAGMADLDLEVTSYENMHACKPQAEYFREVAAMADTEPSECVMVGDDRWLDMPAADVGMWTFYVGEESTHCDWRGDLNDFADLIEQLRS